MRQGWLVLGSTLTLVPAHTALAQDTSPPQAVAASPETWNPASFTAQPQGEPEWFLVEAKPGKQALCDLAWSYRPDRQIIIRRASFGRELTLYLWSEGARVENTRYLSAKFIIDGSTFDGRGREVSFDPLAKTRTVGGSTVRFRLPLAFLDAFASGEAARIEVEGFSSGPIALKSTAAAVREFKACKDLPPPEIATNRAPPPISTSREAPPPSPSLARPAKPRSERRWMTRIVQNYPSRALREELEGRVGLSVTIAANGRVTNCLVTSSSGHQVLDEAACKGMKRYARFNPELDSAGNPTIGRFSTAINYTLSGPERLASSAPARAQQGSPVVQVPVDPGKSRRASAKDAGTWARQVVANYPPQALREEQEGTVSVRVLVSPEGRPTNCVVTVSSGYQSLDDAACDGMMRYSRFNPALDSEGKPATGQYSTRVTFLLSPPPAPTEQ